MKISLAEVNVQRKLAAILCADVYGYSRLMEEDEEATLQTLSAYRKIIDSLIENHRERFVNLAATVSWPSLAVWWRR